MPPVLEFGRKLVAVLSLVSLVVWLVGVVTSRHHHALTFWLVLALGLLSLAFCSAWLDERSKARRLQAPEGATGFAAWLPGRIAAAEAIKRERRVQGDNWYVSATNDWDTKNVIDMGGELLGIGGAALAPGLVDSYRRDPDTGLIGIPPPHGVAEIETQFEQRLAWLERTLSELDGKRRLRRQAAGWLARRRSSPRMVKSA